MGRRFTHNLDVLRRYVPRDSGMDAPLTAVSTLYELMAMSESEVADLLRSKFGGEDTTPYGRKKSFGFGFPEPVKAELLRLSQICGEGDNELVPYVTLDANRDQKYYKDLWNYLCELNYATLYPEYFRRVYNLANLEYMNTHVTIENTWGKNGIAVPITPSNLDQYLLNRTR